MVWPMIDLGTLRLRARGGQADIYDLGNDRIIRVPRRPQDFGRIRYEYEVYLMLSSAGINAPRAYELVEIDGVPCIVMENIRGMSMMDRIKTNPLACGSKARELAGLHAGILSLHASASISSGKEKSRFCISSSPLLKEEEKASLLELLETLPVGTALCHGDFHPGNILYMENKSFVIDWSAASRGDFLSDIAHTYILLKVVPRLLSVSAPMHSIQKTIGRAMARIYLKAIFQLKPFDVDLFPRWLLILAAERTYYGLPSEKDRLVAFVKKNHAELNHGRILTSKL
jgi:tRNA A-37 threonylcarbamoyl transferase component Bud32